MEFWPSVASASKKRTGKEKRGKGSSKETWLNYPTISHGGQSAATLVKVGEDLEWRSLHSVHKCSLIARGEPCKIYPCTKPKGISNHDISLKERAQQGAKFLRTYHPDIDIPFDLIKDELEYDDKFSYGRTNFDSFMGNIISATYCNEGIKKRAIALAFPTGILNRDLNISPVNLRPNSVVFQPRTQPLWTFDTPIFQIVTSAPAINMEEKKGYYIAARTFGLVSLFDVRNRMTAVADSRKSPFAISELMSIRSSTDKLDGRVMDMSFSASQPSDLFLITDRGIGYRSSFRSGNKHIQQIFDKQSEDNSASWRIAGDQTVYGGTVMSKKIVRKFDTRSSSTSADLFSYHEGRNVITSICPTQVEHLLCISTTSQVIWIDERFSRRPLLGWKHYRAFDRSLSLQSVEFGDASLALLSSSKNDHISAISVGKLQDGPLQCKMPSQAMRPTITGSPTTGRTIIRHPGSSSDSFSLIELSIQGSLHYQELRYAMDTETVSLEQANIERCFDYVWSDDVHELEKQSKELEPDYGKLASRELIIDDLTDIYRALFDEEMQSSPEKALPAEEAGTIDAYEALEKMPFFWQRSDLEEEHLRTLFDVAFGSGEEPLHEARADFLTGTIFDSSRGYRIRKQDRFPIAEIANKAAWHMNIQKIMNRISPNTFKESSIAVDKLDPYNIDREIEIPDADRRESEAREQLALDLTLSMDVFGSTLIKDAGQKEAFIVPSENLPETTLLTEAAEKLSLSSSKKEPPQMNFGFHRPIIKHGQKHYTKTSQDAEGQAAEEGDDEGIAKMPLGVRLLLAEWNVGDDPYDFEYADVYDLDGSGAQAQIAKSRSQFRHWRPSEEVGVGPSRPTQSQVPPKIVTARSLAATQEKSTTAKFSQIGFGQSRKPRGETHTQIQHGVSQVETEPASSQPTMMVNTQVVPGPFGGRKVPKKKPLKKRMGGF